MWTNKTDWRKNVSRAEANGLRARIAELEAMLQAQSAPRPPDNSFTDVPKGYTASSSASHSDVTRPYSGTSVAPPSRPPLPAPSGLWEPLPKPPTASGSMPTSAGDSSRPKSSRSRYTPRDSGFDHQYNSLVTPERDDEDDVEVLMVSHLPRTRADTDRYKITAAVSVSMAPRLRSDTRTQKTTPLPPRHRPVSD